MVHLLLEGIFVRGEGELNECRKYFMTVHFHLESGTINQAIRVETDAPILTVEYHHPAQ